MMVGVIGELRKKRAEADGSGEVGDSEASDEEEEDTGEGTRVFGIKSRSSVGSFYDFLMAILGSPSRMAYSPQRFERSPKVTDNSHPLTTSL